VLGLGALLLALVGILAAWLLIPRSLPIPYFVSIALSEYDDPRLPAPAFARQDAAALLVPFGEKAGKAFGSQQNQLLTREIDALRERDDRPLVVHLCALARVAGGEVYLLPADARLDAFPGDAKPLADVLRSLKACQAPNKLLLLDISRPLADPLRGILCDDVAEYLEAAVKAIDDPHLFVLAACSPGQVALV
jgi:hypothetical protein